MNQVVPGNLCDDVAFLDGLGVWGGGDEEAVDGSAVAGTLAADAEGWMDAAIGVRFYPFYEIRAIVVAMFVGRNTRRSGNRNEKEGEDTEC